MASEVSMCRVVSIAERKPGKWQTPMTRCCTFGKMLSISSRRMRALPPGRTATGTVDGIGSVSVRRNGDAPAAE